MNIDAFSSSFRAWVDRAANTIDSNGAAVVVADAGGEIRFYVREGGVDGFSLTRAERSEAERFIMSSQTLTDVERFLTVELAGGVRQREGLDRLHIPGHVGEYAAGISGREVDGMMSVSVGQRAPIRFVKRDPYRPQPDVQFSHFAHASISEIVESALNASGAPLFATS